MDFNANLLSLNETPALNDANNNLTVAVPALEINGVPVNEAPLQNGEQVNDIILGENANGASGQNGLIRNNDNAIQNRPRAFDFVRNVSFNIPSVNDDDVQNGIIHANQILVENGHDGDGNFGDLTQNNSLTHGTENGYIRASPVASTSQVSINQESNGLIPITFAFFRTREFDEWSSCSLDLNLLGISDSESPLSSAGCSCSVALSDDDNDENEIPVNFEEVDGHNFIYDNEEADNEYDYLEFQ